LVGRQTELAEIRELLSSTRLLTLSGAGGCGKTRLGLQAAVECLQLYSGGTWFVDLAPVSDPNQVVSAMTAAAGLREQPGRSLLETAIEYFQPREVLLVLDNCEHVVEACAWMVESLTRRAPALTVLATSREPLGVAGEKVWRVPPLDEASAVQLFEQRARQRANAFAVTPENASTVRAICTRLDYIPLAIELAAPRVALIPPDQILERLDQRFQLRHPTIRSAHDPHRVHSLQPGGRGARPLRRPAPPGHWCATQSRAPSFMSLRMHSNAWCAVRFGRNPNEPGRKLASKIGSRTSLAAVCATRSRTRGIPSGRRSFGLPGLGM